jgi:vacuolar-type H+-ATPase subunit H
MDTSDSKTRELWGRKVKIVKNGLDEAEVLSFVGGLMDEKNALASKLEHLHSLTKLAERTVMEGNRQAQSMIKEAEEKANANAASIIAEAEEKARKEIQRITLEGERKARQSAHETIAAAEQQAQEVLKAAEEKAESIKTNASDQANKIIVEAEQSAVAREQQAHKMLQAAEEKAEVKESSTVYEGNVEVVVAPPIGLDLMQLHKHLRNMPNIEVLNLGISADKTITIRVSLENPTPLRKILEDLPEVETTVDAPQDAEVTFSTKKTWGKAPVRRIMVTTRKQTK